MDARSSVETIRMNWSSRPDPPNNHGFPKQPTTPESRRSTPPVRNISVSATFPPGNLTIPSSQRTVTNSFRHSSSSAGGGSVEFSDIHSSSNESAPGFDVISSFERLSHTSQATSIEPFPHEHVDDFGPPTPFLSQDMEHLEDAELQEIKAEGAKLSSQIERYLQHQIIAQTNARASVLSDRPHVKYASSISEYDVERRRHQEEIRLLTDKLKDKEAECKRLKTQNPISGLQADLAEAKKYAEALQETIHRQNKELISLDKKLSYFNRFDPPSYDEKAAFSLSSTS